MDLLIGLASALGLSHFFPGAADDFVPWDETPLGDYIESMPPERKVSYGEYSSLLALPPPNRPDIPTSDFLRPIQGLEDVLGFTPRSLAMMAGVPEDVLAMWRLHPPSSGEGREKLALLSTFFTLVIPHFDGKPKRMLYEWLATPREALGGRPPVIALGEARLLEVVNFAALWSLREQMNSRTNR
jgi:hypothetical protein